MGDIKTINMTRQGKEFVTLHPDFDAKTLTMKLKKGGEVTFDADEVEFLRQTCEGVLKLREWQAEPFPPKK